MFEPWFLKPDILEEYVVLNPGFWNLILNPGWWTLIFEPWFLNPGFLTLVFEPWFLNPDFWTLIFEPFFWTLVLNPGQFNTLIFSKNMTFFREMTQDTTSKWFLGPSVYTVRSKTTLFCWQPLFLFSTSLRPKPLFVLGLIPKPKPGIGRYFQLIPSSNTETTDVLISNKMGRYNSVRIVWFFG